ncbi:Ni/Fe hydrogenase subunit alpha [Geomonas sp.]|uniref:Ni/Fe hydrogenase subunit alpha n=1 Tax=Geomonas sp. TaxID=2651584 RepID=UPI002B494F80|nr:Ni/Fe hydrogenase subunit alpha [Geomonas sp.]HJV35959.1 Ni/Fe hydrogenase subunit alpha [Geomonas sp.]
MGSVVEIKPLTRVEGHGSLKVFLDGHRAERVELRLTDSPRLFEALLIGKGYREVPDIVCRICSLCSTVHKVTALTAVERALGIEVSELTRLTRELITAGGMLQDHALHLYFLLLPDLMGERGVSGLVARAPETVRSGLRIKRVGNLIQETVGGRLIHPVNITVGGLGQRVGKDALLRLKDELLAILPECRQSYQLFRSPVPFPPLPEPAYLALHPSPSPISGELLRSSTGSPFAIEEYRDHVVETVLPYSYAKHARVDGEEPTVGALSRLNLGAVLGAETGTVFTEVRADLIGCDIRGNVLAQAIELSQAAERALQVIDLLLELGSEGEGTVEITPSAGKGSAASEAPRGVLIHSYGFDQDGRCTEADVITPTSLNQGALARDLLALARGIEGCTEAELRKSLEHLVRCYDPCISCSVHLIEL